MQFGTTRPNALINPLPEFRGVVCENPERHINDFKREIILNHVVDEVQQMLFFASTLKGEAAEWPMDYRRALFTR